MLFRKNHDMHFAYSPDLGISWLNNGQQQISNTTAQQPIVPVSAGITIFSIPKYGWVRIGSAPYTANLKLRVCSISGILNQEAQTVDPEGRVHALNRENTTGTERWFVACAYNMLHI